MDPATTEIYTLSLHDALPISSRRAYWTRASESPIMTEPVAVHPPTDRKSTRLNSSHQIISYAVFCLKKKKNQGHESHDPPHKPTLNHLSGTILPQTLSQPEPH